MDREKNSRFLGRGNKSHPGNLRANLTLAWGWRSAAEAARLDLLSDEEDDLGRAVGNRKRIGYDLESVDSANRRERTNVSRPGFAVVRKTRDLNNRLGWRPGSASPCQRLANPRTMDDRTGQSTATRIMPTPLDSPAVPSGAKTMIRGQWVLPLDFWWIEKGRSPTRVRLLVHLFPRIASHQPARLSRCSDNVRCYVR